MPLSKDQIKTAALELDPIERTALAEELLLSVSDEHRDVLDAAWLQEAYRRDSAFLAGVSHSSSVDEVMNTIQRNRQT